jgi:putative aldouronate transport system permease protein
MILMTRSVMYPLQTFLRSVIVASNLQSVLTLDPKDLYELSDRSARGATIFISTIPILLVYPFVQRYFIVGIRLGAVKG